MLTCFDPVPTVACCMADGWLDADQAACGCVCSPDERLLRAYAEGRMPADCPMPPLARAWCLDEIRHVEGYDWTKHVKDTDQDLARTVLAAWTDYARDKGLL